MSASRMLQTQTQILYLDKDPVLSAQALSNTHLSIQCLQIAKLLSYVQNGYGSLKETERQGFYRSVKNQLSGLQDWIRSKQNYDWAYAYFKALIEEHEHRFNQQHPSSRLLKMLESNPFSSRHKVPNKGSFDTPPYLNDDKYILDNSSKPLANNQLEHMVSSLLSYRNLYSKTISTDEYTNRDTPDWLRPARPTGLDTLRELRRRAGFPVV